MAFVPKKEIVKTAQSKVATNVTFIPSEKTISVSDVDFRELLFAINVTDGITIFDPATAGKTGRRRGATTTLTFDTSAMSDSDDILVIYEPKEEPKSQELLLGEIIVSLNQIKNQLSLITGFGTEEDQ